MENTELAGGKKASWITGHGIEETDWNQCDSCGKPIYDEEPAVSPAPTLKDTP